MCPRRGRAASLPCATARCQCRTRHPIRQLRRLRSPPVAAAVQPESDETIIDVDQAEPEHPAGRGKMQLLQQDVRLAWLHAELLHNLLGRVVRDKLYESVID